MLSVGVSLVGNAHAGIAVLGTNAPVLGSIMISNLVGAPPSPTHGTDYSAQSNIDTADQYTYIANDKSVPGQTFTTGTNTSGYKVVAITLRNVVYNTYTLVPGINYTVRITRPLTTNTLAVVASETTEVGQDPSNCDTCNFPTSGNQYTSGPGTGRFITFILDSPVPLASNTLYGFDVGGGDVRHYWETDGRARSPDRFQTPEDPYPGGNAYNTGQWNGHADNTMTNMPGDRVFVVAMMPGNVVIPPRFTRQPRPGAFYAGETARLTAKAAGDTNLVYQWRKDGGNLSNGNKFSGVLTDTLSISNISVADDGAYTLVVTNWGGSVTSSPAATVAVVSAPVNSSSYAYAVYTNHALAHWRLNEAVDPSTNPPTYDYIGGGVGSYQTNSLKAAGPGPSAFPGFESGNTGVQITYPMDQSWATLSSLDLNTNTVTLTGWIYPMGPQVEFAGLLWTEDGATRAGLAYGNHYTSPSGVGQLTYTWNQGGISAFPSGLTIPSDQWSFIALVISPSSGTLYLGSGGPLASAVNTTAHRNELWTGPWRLGYDPYWAPPPQYVFNGVIDEVAVFRRAMTLDEVNTLYDIGRGIVQPVPPAFSSAPPSSQVLYAGRTARFSAVATGSAPLAYHWQKNGTNLYDSGNISGTQTNTLVIANVGVSDQGTYTLVVTNSVGAVTSAPPATLTLVVPSGKAYEAAVIAGNPVAFWRLNDMGDPSTNTPAFEYWGGLAGTYGINAQNGFNSIAGPQPPDFPQFEVGNTAWQGPAYTSLSWVTVPALNLNTNTVTITFWLQPTYDPVNPLAGLFFTRDGTASVNGCGLRYSATNTLSYVWNLAAIQFDSGFTPPVGQWSFAALVIEPTQGTLYLYNTNSLSSATNMTAHNAEAWDGTALIGYDGGYYDYNFPGVIDEVAVFNYAFTPAQVLDLYNAAFSVPAPSVTLNIQRVGANVVLSWPQGTLLEANDVTGSWSTNNAASPYTNAPAAMRKFYRVIVR